MWVLKINQTVCLFAFRGALLRVNYYAYKKKSKDKKKRDSVSG